MARTRVTRKRPDRTGQRERRRSHEGRTRLPDLRREYRYQREPVVAGDFEFHFTLLGRKEPINVDRFMTEASWTDEQSALSGALTLQRPDPEDPSSLIVAKGYRVRCAVRWGKGNRSLWTMRVQEAPVDPLTGLISVTLSDDLVLLTRNRRDWVFRKTKKRKRGYFCHDVAREVAKREGLRLGRIAKGRKRFDKLVKKGASGLDVLRAAYLKEQDATGVRFVIRLRGTILDIVPYERNVILYQLGEGKEEGAELTESGADRPVTVIEAKGHVGKGKGATKVKATVLDRGHVRRFGRVVEERNYGKVDSRRDLMDKARRDLAKAVRVKRTGTLTYRGIPFIRRGDGVRWLTNEPGWYGKAEHSRDRSFLFTTSAAHSIAGGGDYQMTLGVVQEDPFFKDQERLDKFRRQKARERRKRRRARGDHSG